MLPQFPIVSAGILVLHAKMRFCAAKANFLNCGTTPCGDGNTKNDFREAQPKNAAPKIRTNQLVTGVSGYGRSDNFR